MIETLTLQSFLVYFVSLFFRLLELALIIHILLSWFARGKSPMGQAVDRIIVPLLRPFRFAAVGGISFAPILLLFAIYFVQDVLLKLIMALFA